MCGAVDGVVRLLLIPCVLSLVALVAQLDGDEDIIAACRESSTVMVRPRGLLSLSRA
jgi:hypothetical protein